MVIGIITAIIGLSILIIFHEFGHFLLARRNNVKVNEFSVGFGPKILGVKRGNTLYKISAFLFGGYVRLSGSDPSNWQANDDEFLSKPAGTRARIVLSGPLFNLFLGFLIYILCYYIHGNEKIVATKIKTASKWTNLLPYDEVIKINDDTITCLDDMKEKCRGLDSAKFLIKRNDTLKTLIVYIDTSIRALIEPIIGEINKRGPAWRAGIRKGDKIISVDGKFIPTWDSLVRTIYNSLGKELTIGWLHNGEYKEAKIKPYKDRILEDGKLKEVGMIGISLYTLREKISIIKAITLGFTKTIEVIGITFYVLKKMMKREISTKAVGGPIAIVEMMEKSAGLGFVNILSMMAFISLQLFIFNLIPFPPLDGGMLLLLLIEKIKGSLISEKTLRIVQAICLSLFMLLILLVTMNDIRRLISQ